MDPEDAFEAFGLSAVYVSMETGSSVTVLAAKAKNSRREIIG